MKRCGVCFDVADTGLTAAEFSDRLMQRGVRIGAHGGTSLRALAHLDVTAEQVRDAAGIVADLAASLAKQPAHA